jgi:hypothetical protein
MLEMYLFPSSASLNKVLLAAVKYESTHLKHFKHVYLLDFRIFVFCCAVYVTVVGLHALSYSYIPSQCLSQFNKSQLYQHNQTTLVWIPCTSVFLNIRLFSMVCIMHQPPEIYWQYLNNYKLNVSVHCNFYTVGHSHSFLDEVSAISDMIYARFTHKHNLGFNLLRLCTWNWEV